MTIDKNSFAPLYHQLATEIKEQIVNGQLKSGDSIPSESQLIKNYNLSRGTVRQAMQHLTNENLIEKFPGRGSFVTNNNPLNNENIKVQSIFTQIQNNTHKKSSISIIESGMQNASKKIQNLLKLKNESKVMLLERLLFIEDEPWSIEKSFYPKDISKDLNKIDLLDSVYEQFEKLSNKKIILTKYIIESLPADEETSIILKVDPGTPLFQLIRISYLENNTPFELSYDTYRADRLRFNLSVSYNSDEIKFNIRPHKKFR